MSVRIGPGFSIVIRKDALDRAGVAPSGVIGSIGDLVAEDDDLLVLGPLFDPQAAIGRLQDSGLEYFQDFFDIPHSGGPVAEWCQIDLRLRSD